MEKIQKKSADFIICHEGILNKVLHGIGLILIIISIWQKEIIFLIIGGLIQESGHFYQYYKTKLIQHSPKQCVKTQVIFAYPVFAIIAAYILFI